MLDLRLPREASWEGRWEGRSHPRLELVGRCVGQKGEAKGPPLFDADWRGRFHAACSDGWPPSSGPVPGVRCPPLGFERYTFGVGIGAGIDSSSD